MTEQHDAVEVTQDDIGLATTAPHSRTPAMTPDRNGPSKLRPGGAPDQETADLMHELSNLQTWAVLLATKGIPKASDAMDLIQRVRVFIVERTYNSRGQP